MGEDGRTEGRRTWILDYPYEVDDLDAALAAQVFRDEFLERRKRERDPATSYDEHSRRVASHHRMPRSTCTIPTQTIHQFRTH